MSRKIVKRILCKCKNINCNNTIEMRPKEKGHKLFCSTECKKEYNLNMLPNKVKCICKECGTIFIQKIQKFRQNLKHKRN